MDGRRTKAPSDSAIAADIADNRTDSKWVEFKGERMNLQDAIQKMAAMRGDKYRPRTRHLDAHGRAKYTNRLFLESSPYLLQHAHNPVDWYPWGGEAFDAARRLDRPVLLSVGYSTCHWCHVMEEESFEDEEIARYLNANYIAVKVDREERPDVDAIYMSAVQAITGRGGWPMTVWLTSDREPFYGGTYFPARDGERGASVGFFTLLKNIRASYDDRRGMVSTSAAELSAVVQQMLTPTAGSRLPAHSVMQRAIASATNRFDRVYGGIAGAPKFPSSLPIRLLMRFHHRHTDPDSLEMATLTLEKMAAGGMHDQIGGGFHRYSTDARWLVPHFEKMLYDNALLVPVYIEAWQLTGNPIFKQVAVKTLDYIAREMTSPYGAFYSATDADSITPGGHREEGWYFTWTLDELRAVLGVDDARIAAAIYGVDSAGNFEGRSILHLPRDLHRASGELGVSEAQLATALARINAVLYDHRQKRPAPLRDEKVLTSWNGLTISAFARAGFAFDDTAYLQQARRAADFILDNMADGGRLRRSFKDGAARGNGFLDDYGFFTAALLDLFAATAEQQWLTRAVDLEQTLADRFADHENGGYFMTADDHEALIAREKPILDGALPSGNAVALMNLVRLNELTLDPSYLNRAKQGFTAFSAVMEANPSAFGDMLLALDDFAHPPGQVIVVSPEDGDGGAMADRLRKAYLAGRSIILVSEGAAARLSQKWPLFRGKRTTNGQVTAYVCQNGTCRLPVSQVGALMGQLDSQ